ncbi:MAG: uracil-DNA glycosylase [Desulfobulbaceae bacterium]|jgi:uracil-DNA glycosylase family 4|nr:uracil-DNA glycosylase [Desulfobulbaceae bacterium]
MPPINAQHNDFMQIVQDIHRLASLHGDLGLEYPQTEERLLLYKNKSKAPAVKALNVSEPRQAKYAVKQQPAQKIRPTPVTPVSTSDIDNCREGISLCSSCPHRNPPKFGIGTIDHPFIFVICDKNSSDPSRPMEEAEESLLGKMLQSIKIKPHQIFVTNIIKCANDNTTPPHQQEMAANCLSHTRQQIRLMQPALICTMGQLSSQTVLHTSNQLMALRGHFHNFMDIPLMATYHPAQLLSLPELKKAAWYDLQLMQRKLAMAKD